MTRVLFVFVQNNGRPAGSRPAAELP